MKKRASLIKDKKAQEMSITTLILLVLGVVILVVIVIGFTRGWDYVTGVFGFGPGDLEKAAQSCQISAQNQLKTSYCNEFKELKIAGKKQFANCDWLESTNKISIEATLECDQSYETLANDYCQNIEESKRADITVNDKLCSVRIPA